MEAIKNAVDFSDFPAPGPGIGLGALFTGMLVFPFFPHSSFAMATMIQFFMFSLYSMGWNTIGGYGGQVDLGQAQFVGIGAYTTTVCLLRWDIPFWVSMPIGVVIAICWSFIIGYPLFKLKGHYFAIASIATSLVLKDVFETWNFVGAARGLGILPSKYQPPDFLRLIFREDIYYYYFILGFFVARAAVHELVPPVPPRVPAALDQGQRGGGALARHQRALGQDQDLRHRGLLRQHRGIVPRRATSRTSSPRTR